MPPKLHVGALSRSSVFCRMRPFAEEGGHAASEKCDQKTIESWDETSVTIATDYMFSKGEKVAEDTYKAVRNRYMEQTRKPLY